MLRGRPQGLEGEGKSQGREDVQEQHGRAYAFDRPPVHRAKEHGRQRGPEPARARRACEIPPPAFVVRGRGDLQAESEEEGAPSRAR